MVSSWLIMVILLSNVSVLAQDTGEDVQQERKAETEDERVARMLGQFDRENVLPERIVVSFTATVNKQRAVRVLENFDLHLLQTQVCMSVVNPGEEPQEQGCSMVDAWNDRLKTATAVVPAGMDMKILALALYRHDDIEWVEPSYTETVAGGDDLGADEEEETEQESLEPLEEAVRDELNVFERLWMWLKSLFS